VNSNLNPTHKNYFWRVTRPFFVYVRVGYSDSNTYFGASMALGTVYRVLTLKPGDEVHALFGGVFVVTPDGVFSAEIKLSEKHPFEKTYLPERDVWPLDSLEPLATPKAVTQYNRELPRITPGKFYGRNIDSIVEGA
jgi:hypothetical protein